MALEHLNPSLEGLKPVLFVMSIQNYKNYPGFRANTSDYSPYCHEQEVILMEGIRMFVMKVEERKIDDKTSQIDGPE